MMTKQNTTLKKKSVLCWKACAVKKASRSRAARETTSDEVKQLRFESAALKEALAEAF